MKQYIVITSINKPTKAIIEFSKPHNHAVIVVADKKNTCYLDTGWC
jgi:hypothetical protein